MAFRSRAACPGKRPGTPPPPSSSSCSGGSRPSSRRANGRAGRACPAGEFPGRQDPRDIRLVQPGHAGRLGARPAREPGSVDRHEDLVLYDPVGTGKTHPAIAIGRLAADRGVPVRFFTATGLLMRLRRTQADSRLDKEPAAIGKAGLVIIDEFGYLPVDEEGSRLPFQIIADSYETRSVIHTTNIEFSGWGRVLGDRNMAAALIDRTVHHRRAVRFQGTRTAAGTRS